MTKKKDEANEPKIHGVNVYVVNKPMTENRYTTQGSVNIGRGEPELTEDVFHGALAKASRRISEPESRKKRT